VGLIARTREALHGDSARASLDHMDPGWQMAQVFGQGMYGGGMPITTMGGRAEERISPDFSGLTSGAYRANGVIFACMLNRQLAFSTIRFQYQRLAQGRPSAMFGDQSLLLLEEPWPGGTTQDLLTRVIVDADLAGNSFHTVETSMARVGGDGGQQLVRMRPDWMTIVLGQRASGLGREKIGYVYCEDGPMSGNDMVPLPLDEVSHYAPIVDPLATHRGMSWLTPVIREIQSDGQMNLHKQAFFVNGGTPNAVVKHPPSRTQEQVQAFKAKMDAAHEGASNAYKWMHVDSGTDVTVIGTDFRQIEFAVTQGHGETRIAAAAGVPPVIVGLSEGLAAATYSNYGQARRRFADGTLHPLWQNVAGSFAPLLSGTPALRQAGVRLWYDTRDVPLLREDEKDAAEIQQMEAATMRQLVDAGYTPGSVQAAMLAGDFGLLEHSGLFSVQLQAAGAQIPPALPATEPPSLTVAGG
jgi:phage portal protein BeeE